MFLCTYECMHECICVCKYIYARISARDESVYESLCVGVFMRLCMYMCVCERMHVWVLLVQLYIWVHISVHWKKNVDYYHYSYHIAKKHCMHLACCAIFNNLLLSGFHKSRAYIKYANLYNKFITATYHYIPHTFN